MNTLTPESLLPSLWLPPSVSDSLQEYVDVYDAIPEDDYSLLTEEAVARKLAYESHRHFRDTPTSRDRTFSHNGYFNVSTIYRAARAAKEGVGNCAAHSEAIGVIGLSLGLDMRHLWNGTHVHNLWYSRRNVWLIDGQTLAAHRLYNYEHIHPQHLALDALHNSRMYTRLTFVDGVAALQSTPIEGALGQTVVPYEGARLTLSVAEGVQMLSAMGDLKKFSQPEHQGKISALDRAQLLSMVPPPRIPIPAVELPA